MATKSRFPQITLDSEQRKLQRLIELDAPTHIIEKQKKVIEKLK